MSPLDHSLHAWMIFTDNMCIHILHMQLRSFMQIRLRKWSTICSPLVPFSNVRYISSVQSARGIWIILQATIHEKLKFMSKLRKHCAVSHRKKKMYKVNYGNLQHLPNLRFLEENSRPVQTKPLGNQDLLQNQSSIGIHFGHLEPNEVLT